MIAKVEPLTPARALRGPFDYRLGELEGVDVGRLLLVPFGRRQLLGVVVELAGQSDVPSDRLVEPLAVLDADVPEPLVELGLWVGREYCSTPARGLALVLPPGTGTGVPRVVGPRRALVAAVTDAGLAALGDGGARLGPRQRAALEALVGGPLRVTSLAGATGCDHAGVRRLERRGLVRVEIAEQHGVPVRQAPIGARGPAPQLNEDQRAALVLIEERFDKPPAERKLLLHGVTGSGKTEVYLQAVAAVLGRGQSAIVLVPEIGLTPQTAGRFVERFGDTVAVLHSRLTERERFDEWARLRSGEARVCVGPRSAIFAPLTELGLIIVDEEHDSSYKQEGDPRYDARHVAERRAAEEGALLVAGSATPRPETFARLERVLLPQRVDGRPLPPVELVGMAKVPGPLHDRTLGALDRLRHEGGKAIVLLNRRGWSNFLTCRGCGRAWGCPECDVTLVLHRAERRVRCHHCGHSERVPETCPDCGSVSVARHGAGTEQLERELEALLDPVPVLRLDTDTLARGGAADTLRRFDAADSAVLVGTQMVAKGHDFPDVTLGVVLDADATLRFPDFRAEERTFALVAQLAGRSGRGPRGGEVIVQALDPDARALRHAAAHDADGFLAGELARREVLGYPPYGHLVRIVCSARETGPEAAAAEAIRERIGGGALRLLGPAPLFRRQGKERAQLIVKSTDRRAAIEAVRAAVEAVASDPAHKSASFAVDVDPQ